jgi:hypothetical protein
VKAKTKRRGGTIDLRGTKPRGLPLRKPRYGPGRIHTGTTGACS